MDPLESIVNTPFRFKEDLKGPTSFAIGCVVDLGLVVGCGVSYMIVWEGGFTEPRPNLKVPFSHYLSVTVSAGATVEAGIGLSFSFLIGSHDTQAGLIGAEEVHKRAALGWSVEIGFIDGAGLSLEISFEVDQDAWKLFGQRGIVPDLRITGFTFTPSVGEGFEVDVNLTVTVPLPVPINPSGYVW